MKAFPELNLILLYNMIALIAAVATNGCIGQNNQLPWHLPEDLKHFKKLTLGQTVLMGRKTFESIMGYLGKPLPGRTSLVITRNKNFTAPAGVKVYTDLKQALAEHQQDNLFVIGGASIYQQTIALADTLYITRVNKNVDGDAFFPEIDPKVWQITEQDERDDFSFITYKKI